LSRSAGGFAREFARPAFSNHALQRTRLEHRGCNPHLSCAGPLSVVRYVSRRSLTILAFVIAGLLTVIGWQQVMIYKQPPLQKLALWFPFLLLIRLPDEILRVLFTLVQFPLFAAAFALGIRRRSVAPVVAAILLSYALCVCVAFAILSSR
jgi:hypothetical protein